MAAKKDNLNELRSETVAHVSLLGVATFKPPTVN